MSSALRSVAIPKTTPTNVTTPNTLCYYDNIINDFLPIPFTVSSGVLDIAVQDNISADLLSTDSWTNDFTSQGAFQASIMGGLSPVSSLGANMLTFLKNFINSDYDSVTNDLTTNIAIYNAPTMTKIRVNNIENERTYEFSNSAPVKTTPDPVSGDSTNNYRVVWIFKSPLVISFKYDGDVKYLTFTSAYDAI
jgi:hypothetical protein